MANRSYLYSLSNQPESYADRPKAITGLSEWPWDIPLVYQILLSGEPRLCASLIAEGLNDDEPGNPTPLYALTGRFDSGFTRMKRFAEIVATIAPPKSRELRRAINEALEFLSAHRNEYFLLETLELDIMEGSDSAALRQLPEKHLADVRAAAEAVDALRPWNFITVRKLRRGARGLRGKFAHFNGVSLGDDFDNPNTGKDLGMGYWSEVLFFDLWNRERFEADQMKS